MAPSQISVSRVLELGIPVSWQEAVAIVGEVSTLRLAGPGPDQPPSRVDADSCFLTRRGAVLLPHPAATAQSDAEVELLRALLAGREMPAELEQIAYGPPPQQLGDALAMFWRPHRSADVAAVAARGLVAEAELQRLVAPQSPGLPTAAPMPPVVGDPPEDVEETRAHVEPLPASGRSDDARSASSTRVSSFWTRSRVAAAVLAVGGVTALALWATARPALPPPPALETPEALVATEVNDWWHTVGGRDGDLELRPRTGGAARPQSAASTATALSSVPDAPAPLSLAGVPTPEAMSPTPTPGTPEPAAASVAVNEVPAAAAVYSWRSDGVEPPVMVFPRMPRSAFPPPETPIDGLHIEVLVAASGQVEAVRLRGRAPEGKSAYRYAMLLAAAKAWQFQPATRAGEPVRYVTRMVLAP